MKWTTRIRNAWLAIPGRNILGVTLSHRAYAAVVLLFAWGAVLTLGVLARTNGGTLPGGISIEVSTDWRGYAFGFGGMFLIWLANCWLDRFEARGYVVRRAEQLRYVEPVPSDATLDIPACTRRLPATGETIALADEVRR